MVYTKNHLNTSVATENKGQKRCKMPQRRANSSSSAALWKVNGLGRCLAPWSALRIHCQGGGVNPWLGN